MRTIGLFLWFIGLGRSACIAVPSSQILAKDISKSIPLFQSLDPNDVIGFSPFPGTVRVLTSRDIVLAARQYGLAFPPGDLAPSVCIERAVQPLSANQIKTALVESLNDPNVQIEVLEFSNQRYPPGHLEFPRATLNHPAGNNPQQAIVWPGRLVYDNNRSLGVWVRVRLSVLRDMIVAKENIARDTVIRLDQVTSRRVPQFPGAESATVPLLAVGKIARRPFAAGDLISPDALADPQDVMRGETVHVQSVDGAASIRLDGIAQSSGRKGDVIVVHNPVSGRNFRATVDGPQQVVVRGSL